MGSVFANWQSEKGNSTKELTIYIGVVEEQALKTAETYEAETGVKVNFVRMSGGEILGRIRAEKNNPKADIWYGGSADSFISAMGDDLLTPYISPTAAKIDNQFKDKDGYWTGIYQGYLGFICEKQWFEENNMDYQTSWDDILDPRLKGQIIIANPGSSSTAYNLLSTQCQMRGEEEGVAYMAALDDQVKQYTTSGSAHARSAALGECAVGITYLHNGIRLMKQGYNNIALSAPQEGTSYELGSVAIIKGAPDLEEAKAFIDWCLSPACQEIGQKYTDSYHFLINP